MSLLILTQAIKRDFLQDFAFRLREANLVFTQPIKTVSKKLVSAMIKHLNTHHTMRFVKHLQITCYVLFAAM